MNTKTVNQAPKSNLVKWLLVVVLLLAGISANAYFQTQPLALRLVGWLILLCAVSIIARYTSQGQKFWSFALSARNEMRKVTWPTRQETVQTTLIVIAMVVIMAIFLWGLDTLLFWLTSLITVSR